MKENFIKDLKRHAVFWIMIYLIWTFIKSREGNFEVYLIVNVFNMICYMTAYYTLIYIYIPVFFNRRKYFLFALSIIFTSFLLLLFMNINDVLWFSHLGKWAEAELSGEFYLRKAIQYYSPGMILLAWESKITSISEQRKIQELEKEKLSTELKFLRSQLNPHFLFNALNNIYSMAIVNEQTEIAHGLENLSSIMHYLTYNSNAEKVPLEKEIALINNYIGLEQLRIENIDDSIISFNVTGRTNGLLIAPVILLPLVENAFKHGIKRNEHCLVSIKIEIFDKVVNLSIKNSFFEPNGNSITNNGIGIENVRRRLELRYPSQYKLELRNRNNYFYTLLNLNLMK